MNKRIRISDLTIGNIYASKSCGNYEIMEVYSWSKVKVRFVLTGYTKVVSLSEINTGGIKDFYYPTVAGVGFLGKGCYPTSYKRGGKTRHTPAYAAWHSRISLCYSNTKNSHNYRDSGVYVCKEWLCFQNFAEWFYRQVKLYGKGGVVDKDLLYLGNKVYSPATCCYIPTCINTMFRKSSGKSIGVRLRKNGRWEVSIGNSKTIKGGDNIKPYIGTYDTEEAAIGAYCSEKIKQTQNMALIFQEKIEPLLFYKMYTGAENYVHYYVTGGMY